MVRYAIIAFAGLAAALPLNINLGAYSPALVVGDGEISFGGAANAAEGANAAAVASNTAGTGTGAGTGAGNAAAAAASTVVVPVPNTVENASTDNTATDPALTAQAQQIAGLQGLGKAIAPRVDGTETEKVGKRDLAGFDRALTYAEAALTKGPKVQLGTGAEGSGVGIIVENTPAAGGGAAEKRDLTDAAPAPRRRAKVTTMFVRRGIPASLNSRSEDAASAAAAAAAAAAIAARSPSPAQADAAPAAVVSKRGDLSAFDAVNLNVDGDAGVTMTFVESFDEGAAEDVEEEDEDEE
ncbi:hypothetical protein C8A01DRAFT_37281 [Parachaetomium inaequale]|uniref:Uncharacterized protein n=1 Tax=Parachaetomium inaequale TaxID=2588326 RepID=A0AAN6PGG5_9PEZI|nr:hypothetical protein C8A01DRAFT_37281 [Parachaetomium inaequale]